MLYSSTGCPADAILADALRLSPPTDVVGLRKGGGSGTFPEVLDFCPGFLCMLLVGLAFNCRTGLVFRKDPTQSSGDLGVCGVELRAESRVGE